MDLRLEAAAAQELRANFEEIDGFEVPTVDWRRTGRRVLTSSWIEGVPIHDRERLEAEGHDLAEIVALMASGVLLPDLPRRFLPCRPPPGQPAGRQRRQGPRGSISASWGGSTGRRGRYLADMLYSFPRPRLQPGRRDPRLGGAGCRADQSVGTVSPRPRARSPSRSSACRSTRFLWHGWWVSSSRSPKRFRMEVQPPAPAAAKNHAGRRRGGAAAAPRDQYVGARPAADRGVDDPADGAAGARPRDRGGPCRTRSPACPRRSAISNGRSTCWPRTASSSTPIRSPRYAPRWRDAAIRGDCGSPSPRSQPWRRCCSGPRATGSGGFHVPDPSRRRGGPGPRSKSGAPVETTER